MGRCIVGTVIIVGTCCFIAAAIVGSVGAGLYSTAQNDLNALEPTTCHGFNYTLQDVCRRGVCYQIQLRLWYIVPTDNTNVTTIYSDHPVLRNRTQAVLAADLLLGEKECFYDVRDLSRVSYSLPIPAAYVPVLAAGWAVAAFILFLLGSIYFYMVFVKNDDFNPFEWGWP